LTSSVVMKIKLSMSDRRYGQEIRIGTRFMVPDYCDKV
jgi:hypothetical protein